MEGENALMAAMTWMKQEEVVEQMRQEVLAQLEHRWLAGKVQEKAEEDLL